MEIPGVKRHDCLPAWQQRADETEAEKPAAQQPSHIEVDEVIVQLQQKVHQLGRSFGIAHVVASRIAVPRNVDDRAGYALSEQESAYGYQVALHSTVWRRIGA
jgi:hypothetical protein